MTHTIMDGPETTQRKGGSGVASASMAVINGRHGRFQATSNLTPRQRKLVQAIVRNGGCKATAQREAGYADYAQACKTLNLPHVRQAVQIEREKYLEGDIAHLGLRVVKDMLEDQDTPPGTRAKLAMWVVDKAHPTKALKDSEKNRDKPLEEMTIEELEQVAKEGRDFIASLKVVDAEIVSTSTEAVATTVT